MLGSSGEWNWFGTLTIWGFAIAVLSAESILKKRRAKRGAKPDSAPSDPWEGLGADERKIVECLQRGPNTAAGIMQATGLERGDLMQGLAKLLGAKSIRRTDGLWQLTDPRAFKAS